MAHSDFLNEMKHSYTLPVSHIQQITFQMFTHAH